MTDHINDVSALNSPSLLNISTDKISQLTKTNWINWNAVLCSVLLPYQGAWDILTGKITTNSTLYCPRKDRELLAFIHPLIGSSELLRTVRMAVAEHGHWGSRVYAALKDRYLLLDLESARSSLKKDLENWKQNKIEKMECPKQGVKYNEEKLTTYIHRTREAFFRAKELNIELDEKAKVKHFVHGLSPKDIATAIALQTANPDWTWEQIAAVLKN